MPSPFRILEILACSLVSFLPYVLLIVYPFRKQLRFGSGATATITTFAAIIQLVCDLVVGLELIPSSIAMIAALVLHVLLSLVLIRAPFGKKMFTLLSTICAAVVISTASKYLAQSIFPDQGSGLYRWTFLLMLIGLQAVILIPYALMVVKHYSAAIEDKKHSFPWGGLCLIFAAVLAVWVYIALPNFTSLQLVCLVVVPLNIFACLAARYIIRAVGKLEPSAEQAEEPAPKPVKKPKKVKQAAEPAPAAPIPAAPVPAAPAAPAEHKEQPVLKPAAKTPAAPRKAPAAAPAAPKAAAVAAAPKAEVKAPIQQTLSRDHLEQLQSLQLDSLMMRITESDQFHRELRRHVDAMAYRLDRKQFEKLQIHIRSLQEQLSSETEVAFCENRELNNVVTYYNRMAGYCGARVTSNMQLTDNPPVEVEDLTVLLGNLLDNALDACKKQSSRDRRVYIAVRMNGSALYVNVENTYDTALKKSATGRYLSTKHSGYGVGLEVCEQIAARYNGVLELSDVNGIFKATAILRP